jgi:translation initiation factor IF-2
MFPNLRLIIGATIAAIALVMVVGSGLFAFREPYRKIADVPDVGRPLVQHAIAENPQHGRIVSLAHARRNDELQRLLDLPTSPVHAYAAEPPSSFPFELKLPVDDAGAAPPDAAVPPEATTVPSADLPAETSDPTIVALAPVAADPMEDGTAAAPAAPSTPASATADPASAAAPADLAPIAVPGDATAMLEQFPDAQAPAAVDDPSAVPVSPIPAIAMAPLPRANPRIAHGEAGGQDHVAVRRIVRHRVDHPRPRRPVRTVRVIPPPARPAPPVAPPFGTPPDQPSPFESSVFERTGAGR